MYPYLEVFGIGFNMTGLGIIVSLLVFLAALWYLCKKYHKNFLKFFYFLPILIIITYLLWAYVQFVIDVGIFPKTLEEVYILLSPEGYNFHFVGISIGIVISLMFFFRSFTRNENKKIWIDIIFSSYIVAMIPLGIFLLMGDSFLWKPYNGVLSIKTLHPESVLNKFQGVYPIGIFISLSSIISLILFALLKRNFKKFGFGLIGFIVFIILLNIVFFFQQYPKYITISYENIIFDIKNYISFFIIMICFYTYHQRNRLKK